MHAPHPLKGNPAMTGFELPTEAIPPLGQEPGSRLPYPQLPLDPIVV
jgi:hypothetical protein